jgi:hypothetical protein
MSGTKEMLHHKININHKQKKKHKGKEIVALPNYQI